MNTVEALERIARGNVKRDSYTERRKRIAREALPTARAEAEELETLKLRLKDAVTMGQRLEAQAEELAGYREQKPGWRHKREHELEDMLATQAEELASLEDNLVHMIEDRNSLAAQLAKQADVVGAARDATADHGMNDSPGARTARLRRLRDALDALTTTEGDQE